MLRVPIRQAKPGMQLALPVLQPKRPGVTLLHPGVTLDQHEINRLQEMEIGDVWIHVPGLEFVSQYVNPAMINMHAALTRTLATSFDAIRERNFATMDFGEYKGSVAGLLSTIYESPRASVFVQELADRENDLIRHASSVCLISLLMGIRLDAYLLSQRRHLQGLQAKSVANLGLGAMLHDVGMLRLSPETLDRWNRTRDEKDPAWRQHVQIGFDMVQGYIGPTAAATVLHHHQRFDGTGFPGRMGDKTERPLAGNEIHIFARIVGCADLLDKQRHTLHGEVPVVRALSRMLHPPISRWVDPTVLRALLAVVPAYAPGTMVRLNTGHDAAVCNWFPDDPCRPSVLIVNRDEPEQAGAEAVGGSVGARAMRLGDAVRAAHLADPTATRHGGDTPREGDRIDLKARPDLWITHAQDQSVEAYNFYPRYPGEFDLLMGGSTPIEREPLPIDDQDRAANAA